MRHNSPRLMRSTLTLFSSLVVGSALISCAGKGPTTAEGDLHSTAGYKIHYLVEVASTSLDPLAYKVTLTNLGTKALTFKPSPPDCTLYMDPNTVSVTPFRRTASGGLTVDMNGTVKLQPGDTCTLQLAIDDLSSPLRGGTHECQLGVRPVVITATDKAADPYAGVVLDPEPLKSPTFRIAVP